MICRQLLEEAQRRDRDHQAVLTELAQIERLLGMVTSEIEPRASTAPETARY